MLKHKETYFECMSCSCTYRIIIPIELYHIAVIGAARQRSIDFFITCSLLSMHVDCMFTFPYP
jgi:hypothetical protein